MTREERNIKIHDVIVEALDHEVERFWSRSLFFWGFIAAAFVGYGVLIDKTDKDFALAVACFGVVCSIAWTLANRASKFWHEYWLSELKLVQPPGLVWNAQEGCHEDD